MKKENVVKIILLASTLAMAIIFVFVNDNKISKDNYKFKTEYEALNNSEYEGQKYLKVKVPINNNVKYLNVKEVMEFLNNKTGIIYFGFPDCPWCRNIINPLIEVAGEKNQTIYYFNALSIRDVKEVKDELVITKKEGTKEYYQILDKLGDMASVYEGLNDNNIKRLYFPTVVFVKDGKVVSTHIGSVDSQENPFEALNSEQENELKTIYMSNINKIDKGMCTTEC